MIQTSRIENSWKAAVLMLTLVTGVARASEGLLASEGLRTDVPFSDHLHDSLNRADGLPSSWINTILQAGDGYLWIGTDNGLVRFDGHRVKRIDTANSPELPFNEIRSLYEDKDGSIWIGTTRGVARYRPGKPARIERIATFDDATVFAFARDHRDILWVGTERETYRCGPDGVFTVDADAPHDVRAICEHPGGKLWFGSNTGLFCQEGSFYRQYFHKYLPKDAPLDEPVPMRRVNTIHCDDRGDLWVGTNRALLHLADSQFTARGLELATQQIYDVLQTRDGAIYVAARFGIYRSVNHGVFEEVSSEPSAFCLLEDHDQSLWVGHGDNRGLHRYRNHPVETVWDDDLVSCLDAHHDGNVWFGARTGLYRIGDGGVERFGTEHGLPDPRVLSIATGQTKTLWIGTAAGLAFWSQQGLSVEGLPSELENMSIGVLLEDSSGTLWFALGTSGAYRMKDGKLQRLHELQDGRTHFFWEDTDHSILIGHEEGLFRYRAGQIQRLEEPSLEPLLNPRFICHWTTGDGTLWMGTSNGLARYFSGQFAAFPPSCGLGADNVERLAVDERDNLWFGGRDGLCYVSVNELDAFAEHRIESVTAYPIEGFERFPPVRSFSQAMLMRDHMLWVVHGGLKQLSTHEGLRDFRPPEVHVEQLMVDGKSVGFENAYEFSSGKRRVAIHFAEQPFTDPRHVKIRYRLAPFDEHWVDAGEDRNADYTDLRPGTYQFSVSARHGNGPWSQTDSAIVFQVLPRWWERRMVRLGGAILFVGLVFSYARFRISRYRAANFKLQNEIASRKLAEEESRLHLDQLARVTRVASMGELAASIAHEVKQPVSAILTDAETASHLLEKENPDVNQVREALQVISDGGRRVTEIVDRVRALVVGDSRRYESVDLNELVLSVLRLLDNELHSRDVSVSVRLAEERPLVDGNPIELKQVLINLIMNGLQAMENSDVSQQALSISTEIGIDHVELSVCDSGVGIDASKINSVFDPFYTSKQKGMGMGLAIAQTIVRAHGGEISAIANVEHGVTFVVSIPIAPPIQTDSQSEDLEDAARANA